MLALLLAETIDQQVLQEQILNISAVNETDNVSAPDNTNASSPTSTPPPPPPAPIVAVFGTAYEQITVDSPYTSNTSSNASISRYFSGSAYNFAKSFAQIDNDSQIEFLSVFGNDVLAKEIIEDLEKDAKISTKNVDFNDKHKSANVVIINSQEEQAKQAEGASDSENQQEEPKTTLEKVNKTQVFVNNDVFERINYKYAYSHRFPLQSSRFLYFDAESNENALRYIIEHAGVKSIGLFKGASQGIKLADMVKKIRPGKNQTLGYFTIFDLSAANAFLGLSCAYATAKTDYYENCKDADFYKFFLEEYSKLSKKAAYGEYLEQFQEKVALHLMILHLAAKAQNVIIKFPQGAIYSISGVGVIYAEHSCGEKCVVNPDGADEAFAAGLLEAVKTEKDMDDVMEFAGMCEITMLKQEGSTSNNFNKRTIERIAQQSYVSKKWLLNVKEQDAKKAAEQQEGKDK